MEQRTLADYEIPLTREFGAIICGERLWKVLGYRSSNAFRKAVGRKTVPVPLFKETGRRGWFARVHDIAAWLHSLNQKVLENDKEEIEKNDLT